MTCSLVRNGYKFVFDNSGLIDSGHHTINACLSLLHRQRSFRPQNPLLLAFLQHIHNQLLSLAPGALLVSISSVIPGPHVVKFLAPSVVPPSAEESHTSSGRCRIQRFCFVFAHIISCVFLYHITGFFHICYVTFMSYCTQN